MISITQVLIAETIQVSNQVFRVLIDASVAEEGIRRLSGDPPGDQNQNNDMCLIHVPFGLLFRRVAKYEIHGLATAAVPTILPRSIFPAVMNAAKSPCSIRK